MVMDFGVCFSILFACFALASAKSVTRFRLDSSKLHHRGSWENAIQQDTNFVAHTDGSLYNVDPYTGDVRWSFSPGEPLWSSFQDAKTISRWNYDYIDIENGSTFVMRGSDGRVKYRLPDTADQLLSLIDSVPNILAEQIVVGTKRMEVHILDANSGRLVSEHNSAASTTDGNYATDESSVVSDVVETGEKICVVRTTYCFKSFSGSSESKWGLNYSEYRVFVHSQGLDDVVSPKSLHTRNGIPFSLLTRNGLDLEYKSEPLAPRLPPEKPSSHDDIDAKEQRPKSENRNRCRCKCKCNKSYSTLPGPNTDGKGP